MNRLLATMMLCCLAAATWAEDLGRFVYVEGQIELLREGRYLPSGSIRIGSPVASFDTIQTDRTGFAELDLVTPGGGTIGIKVGADTAYYVEPQRGSQGAITSVQLLRGSVSARVQRMSGTDQVRVQTGTAALGVRGTDFDAFIMPDGSVLFGVTSGEVVVTDARGTAITAGAGTAVEALPNQETRAIPFDPTAAEVFYRQWAELRLGVFRAGAATIVPVYTERLAQTTPLFQRAFSELSAFRPRLTEALRGSSNLGQDMRLRAEISPAIIRMRGILPIYEQTAYRMIDFAQLHQEGIGPPQVGGRPAAAYYRDFEANLTAMLAQLAEVRHILRLYGQLEERSFGGLPGGLSPLSGPSLLDSRPF